MKIRILGHEIDPEVAGFETTLSLFAISLTARHNIDADVAQRFVNSVKDVVTAMNPDTQRLDKLRKACGYVENGSSTSVVIGQDDATKSWIIAGGGRDRGYGNDLREAIDKLEIEDDTP